MGLAQGVQLWPETPMESYQTLLASGQVRFERGNVVRFQVPGLVQLKVIIVNVDSVRHRLPQGHFQPARYHNQAN